MSRFDHIACCVDQSEAARRGLQHAVLLAKDVGASKLSVVHLVPPPVYVGVYLPPPEPVTHEVPDWLTELAKEAPGADVVLVDSLSSYPPAEAVAWAKGAGVDMLVAASHQGFFKRALMGSFAAYLAYHAHCPVMLVLPPVQEEGTPAT